MSVKNIDTLFNPNSVAVVGNFNDGLCKGNIILKNLKNFKGKIFALTPDNFKIPQQIDVAFFTCPLNQVLEILSKVEDSKLTNIIISESLKNEKEKNISKKIMEVSKEKNLNILGFNSTGIINPRLGLNLSFYQSMPQDGDIVLISQSGAILTSMLDFAEKNNIGFRYIASIGTIADIDYADIIDYLWGESDVKVILLYIEYVKNTHKFLSSARHTSRIKPILSVKSGNNIYSSKLIEHRIINLVGDFLVYDNAFRRAGIIRVEDINEIILAGNIISKTRIPEGDQLCVITNSGGSGIIVLDELHNKKLNIAKFDNEFIKELKKSKINFEYVNNPIDLSGEADELDYVKCGEKCLKYAKFDTVMVVIVLNGRINPLFIVKQLIKSNIYHKNLIFICLGGNDFYRENLQQYENVFFTIKEAIDSYYYGLSYRLKLKKLIATPPRFHSELKFDYSKAKELIENNLKNNKRELNYIESKLLLKYYTIPCIKFNSIKNFNEIKNIFHLAEEISYPLNLTLLSKNFKKVQSKLIESPKILKKYIQEIVDFKSDFGMILLEEFIENIDIVLQAGIKTDKQFGPYIFLGLGGRYKDITDEISIMLPPLNKFLAKRLIEKSYMYKFLYKLNVVESLEEILIKLSYLSSDFSEIDELIIDPLICSNKSFSALNCFVKIKPSKIPAPKHFVIAPYPNQYEFHEKAKNGAHILIRPIMPEDELMHLKFFYSLSKETNYYRFFSYRRKLSHEQLASFTQIDYGREIAIVAITKINGEDTIIGVNRLVYYPNEDKYEFAIVVTDDWQDQGIGHILMEKLLYIAKDRGIKEIYGSVLAINRKMISFCRKFGFEIVDSDNEIIYFKKVLT